MQQWSRQPSLNTHRNRHGVLGDLSISLQEARFLLRQGGWD